MFDEWASSVKVKLLEYFVDFDRINLPASVLIENQKRISEAFIIFG
jgi:hypothetical protein